MSMSSGRFTTSRRSFLKGAGIAAAAGALSRPMRAAAAEAPTAATYHLENGFIRVAGAYGKLTEFGCDPSGAGHYEKTSFSSVFLGKADYFDAGFNDGVTFTTKGSTLSLADIQMPSAADLTQPQLNAPIPLSPGHTLGQAFTASAFRFTRVGGQFPTWSSSSASMTLSLYSGTPATGLTLVGSSELNPLKDNGWGYVDVPPQPAGVYYLEASDAAGTPGWWGYSGTTTVDVGGASYADRQALTGRSMTIDVAGFNVDGVASWDLTLTGSQLAMSYEMHWQGEARADFGMSFNTSWVKDGYSIDYADGVLFSRFVGDGGDYIPSQQLKRRSSWTNTVSGAKWVAATGTGPYDLRITAAQPILTGAMTSDTLALTLNTGATTPAQVVSRSIAIDMQAHSDALPEIFPIFTASDQVRATQLSTFYWERALSFRFSGHAADWADWNGRILDWTATEGRAAQADSLLSTKQDDDGYVWSWPDSQGWPFPDPTIYDARHFTSNAMYILGAWRYFSWTGDSAFLTTMLPRLRKAMDFYLDTLGGSSGIVTITSPDHSGRDGAVSSNYWDVTSFGYRDAYLNAYFYGALDAMAQLERHVHNMKRAKQLQDLRPAVQKRYNELFWNESAGRYVECIDADGVAHDYGSTYVNLEATSFGLPSAAQAERIFTWLDTGNTELQKSVVLIEGGGLAPMIKPGHTLGTSFTANAAFTSVAARFPTYGVRGAAFTMALYQGVPGDTTPVKVAEKQFSDWGDGSVAHIDVPKQAPGVYYLEVSNVTGTLAWWSSMTVAPGALAYADGVADPSARSRFVVAIGEYFDGPADIYSKWIYAPRATTRRNNYWFFLEELTTPWGNQVQDGGAILYTSGFDVMARARYRGGDDAWQRMTTILDRWKEPDHLCGGTPLFRGESTVDSGTASTSVGTDIPFPESGLAPASFLYAFVGVEAEPDALVFTPALPSTLSEAGVRNLSWHGKKFEIVVTRNRINVSGSGVSISRPYKPGKPVRLNSHQLSH
ncbi:GH116 family glycosyl hydrolase [Microbacterium sp. STN6]|uniref:MGH1-like glycoside hydrolase domain-containing protein n=1 Tax=Microbacterium sp. STN6 TaxID=2995588 RepID=UPI002260F0A4|nr:GH116 family glycosyl hydrolase [Microbacterium sp. STN6]MCX7522549.1 GH116 family glycosyl hydrolase [Microbacterium sp. STN6]